MKIKYIYISVIYGLLFILTSTNTNYANGNSFRQLHKVTLTATDIPLKDVFQTITKQTGIIVWNNKKATHLDETRKITVNFIQTDITEVMHLLLNDTRNLSFRLEKNSIIIFKVNHHRADSLSVKSNIDTSLVPFLINGKITDPAGGSVPGATIILRDTKKGTTSDIDGKFSLSDVKKGEILVISSVGFETQEIIIRNKSIFAELNPHINKLDETQVIAYGSTTKRFSTANITTIKASEIETQPVNNPLLALQGRVPGLVIDQATGLPGSGVTARIQGDNSLRNGNDPLYIVDGVPYSSQLLPGINDILGSSGGRGSYGSSTGNPLSYLNPGDIESIEILKGADATSIYGSRAANGAILITTKRGKAGKMKLEFGYQTGIRKVVTPIKLMNSDEYLEMRHETLSNDNITSPSPTDYDLNGFWDTTHQTNWLKELIGKSANSNNLQLSASGGSDNTQYLISGAYYKESTVFPGKFDDTRGSLHFNLNSASADRKFRIQFSASYMVDNNKLPAIDLTSTALRLAPIAPSLYNSDGTLNWMPDESGTSTFQNPLSYLYQKYNRKVNNLVANTFLSYEILPGLKMESNLGYTNLQTNEISTIPILYYPPEQRPIGVRSALYGNNNMNSWIIEPQLKYKKTIMNGDLEFLLGTTIQQNNANGQQLYGYGFSSDLLMEDMLSAPISGISSTTNTIYKYNALYSRLTYNWKNKYIINLSSRRDGSSRFGQENRFHNFSSIGAAWIFSQETIFQKLFPFVSYGKLRSSYGTTGNDQIVDYSYYSLYDALPTGVPYQGISGLVPKRLTNPYLQWEETKKWEVAMDLGLLKDKIMISANYYRNQSSNQLITYTLPVTTGFNSVANNLPATVQNAGWEFSITSINIKNNNFSWTSGITLTIPKNRLLDYPNLSRSSFASIYIIGKSPFISQVYRSLGVNDSTGVYQFLDSKGNPTYSPSPLTDRIVVIDPTPQFYGGIQNTFTFKGVSLSVLFQFAKQQTRNYSPYILPGDFNGGFGNQLTSALDRWRMPGDIAPIQRYGTDFSLNSPFLDQVSNSDAAWTNAWYIKCRNISLSWQLPQKWKQKAQLQNCSLYILGQNLFTITNYKLGTDPETKGGSALPPLQVFTLGIRISL
ncbi:SusC/RagA family TonB-linked outer membrane protein [Chitinophaga ginsengisegetis]|uniref:SusC/RagA family TonB-linked outer membrane protein n=1 Tax=Chitinophaga ginsengisegetis TaxID=393003 RepID=UPI000DBA86CC|nr:SusC/RagA family TonB-linked outer membrane protein [Chitinophaga ginsengisegetis]MDR6567443.1 TonB-linked SusC/RagA family outer membrane protein [Chitinophaga ginsengisegetis]MDR6647174.1 TonB-linked SusC/RagA family outer membrane protein [Chitinophaga ginsengisegetis]MDR6653523.1 TonB-linked SusC/RagA family outer membrane protein [Chitinophaga ginsengisegetis]